MNALVDMPTKTPNLESVTLKGENGMYRLKGGIDQRLREAITCLQSVIGNLKHLHSLSIKDALSIHPSFLLIPHPAADLYSIGAR